MDFFRKRAEAELQREITYHLHHLAAEFERQGYSRQEALAMARREFGGTEQVKEECRDEWRWMWMNGLRQDVVFGVRMMRRTPLITVAAVLSLALGIGANAGVASLMDIILWRDLPVPNPQRVTLVHWQGQGFPRDVADAASGSLSGAEGGTVADFFSYPTFQALRKSVSNRASLAAYTVPGQVNASYNGRPLVVEQRAVSGNFFSTLEVRPFLGRLLSDRDDSDAAPAVAVVSHRFWANALGSDRNAIGRTITVNHRPHVIAGVLEPGFFGLSPGDKAELYTPVHHSVRRELRRFGGGDQLADNRYWGMQLIARLAPGVLASQLRPAMDTVFRSTWSRQPADASKAPRIRLDEGGRGLASLRREFHNPLLVLGGLVGLLLAIACVNIANLLLARGVARRKEVAMRLALGCSRARLMRQYLTESALLAVLGGAVSVAVAYGTGNVLGRFAAGSGSLPIEVALDYRILAVVGAFTLVTLVLFGVLPAWEGSRVPDADWLKQGGGSMGNARGRWNTGRALVVAQIAMSVVLVMAAVIFTRNLLAIQTRDPGFDRRNLVLFGTRPGTSGYDKARLPQFYFDLEQRLGTTPGVVTAGLAFLRPMNIENWLVNVQIAGQTEPYVATLNSVTPSYLPLYTPRMVAGRNITWTDIRGGAKVAVISDNLAQKLGGASVLGRRLSLLFTYGKPSYEIVGIAPAFAATSMKERPYAVWVPFTKDSPAATVVVRTAQAPQAVVGAIRRTMSEIDRNLPMVDLMTMEEQISRGLQRERMFATLSGGFGILALTLSVIGLYGVMAYSTSRRRSEIGVRLALGAMPRQVVSMVMREGLALALVGMLAGVPMVWLGAKYVEKELSGARALDPVLMLFALGILLVAALVAVGVPALRASALQPSETLRQE
jgi:predicted permease